jgi:hypothetical protein
MCVLSNKPIVVERGADGEAEYFDNGTGIYLGWRGTSLLVISSLDVCCRVSRSSSRDLGFECFVEQADRRRETWGLSVCLSNKPIVVERGADDKAEHSMMLWPSTSDREVLCC